MKKNYKLGGQGRILYVIFGKGHLGKHLRNIILNLDQ